MINLISRFKPSSRILVLTGLSIITMWLGQGYEEVNPDNRLTIGGESVPTLTGGGEPMVQRGPSLVNGMRGHWDESTIVVPVDGTHHYPSFTSEAGAHSSARRASGAYPTTDSSLDLGSTVGEQVGEALLDPLYAAGDIVMFIPRAFMTPPGSAAQSPSAPFERYREYVVESAPAMVPETSVIAPDAK